MSHSFKDMMEKHESIVQAENLNDEDLVEEFARVVQEFEQIRDQLGIIRMLLTQRMEGTGATVMRGTLHNVVGTVKSDYDYSILARLREFLDPDELEGMYTPEHDEVTRVGEKWNMTQTKKLLKLGEPFSTIIEDARVTVGRMSLKSEERKSI